MKLSDISNNVFVINLAHRGDRLEQFVQEAVKQEFKFHIFEGINGQGLVDFPHLRRGEVGLLATYRALLEHCIEKGYDKVIIFEDDSTFVDDFQERLEKEWKELPKSWHAVMLGANHSSLGAGWLPYDQISENVVQVYSSYCCHANVLHKDIFQPFLDQINTMSAPLDVLFCNLQNSHAIFAFKRSLVEQRNSYSDIIQIESNYKDWGIFNG